MAHRWKQSSQAADESNQRASGTRLSASRCAGEITIQRDDSALIAQFVAPDRFRIARGTGKPDVLAPVDHADGTDTHRCAAARTQWKKRTFFRGYRLRLHVPPPSSGNRRLTRTPCKAKLWRPRIKNGPPERTWRTIQRVPTAKPTRRSVATVGRLRERGWRNERLQRSGALRIELLGFERQSGPGPGHVGQD